MSTPDALDNRATIYEQQVRIAASPETVFALLVTADGMARWMGVAHDVEATPGGRLRIDINGRDVVRGAFVLVEPPTRAVFSWGWEGSADMPPGSSTVEITLRPDGDSTILTLVHRDCPPPSLDAHAHGWRHYLGRLAAAATGGAGPDPWVTTRTEDP